MNVLEAKITEVADPVWDEEYQTWRVAITYNCWGSESKSERWFKNKPDAAAVQVGDVIYV